jgi:hypothetical protein
MEVPKLGSWRPTKIRPGARPKAEVPDPSISDYTTCALKVAVRSGHLDIIKQLKPQNYSEILPALLLEIWSKASLPAD